MAGKRAPKITTQILDKRICIALASGSSIEVAARIAQCSVSTVSRRARLPHNQQYIEKLLTPPKLTEEMVRRAAAQQAGRVAARKRAGSPTIREQLDMIEAKMTAHGMRIPPRPQPRPGLEVLGIKVTGAPPTSASVTSAAPTIAPTVLEPNPEPVPPPDQPPMPPCPA